MTVPPWGQAPGPNGGSLTAAIGRRKMAWVQRGIGVAGCRLFPSRWWRFRVPAAVPLWDPDSRNTCRTAGTGAGLT